MPLIYLVAGEASGDVLGARLMAALRTRRPDLDLRRHRRRADGAARSRQPVPDAGPGADGPAGSAAAPAPSAAPAAPDGCRHRGAPARRGGDDRQPRLHAAPAEGDPATRRQARALRGAAGLGLARTSRAALSRTVGSVALPAAIRAGVLRPPRPAGDVRRPSRAGERRRSRRCGAVPHDTRHRSRRARADADAGQPAHRGVAAAADPWRDVAASAGCRAGRAGGRTGGGGGARGHTRLAAAAGAGVGVARTSTTPSPPRPPR